jgi:hypothetical protein
LRTIPSYFPILDRNETKAKNVYFKPLQLSFPGLSFSPNARIRFFREREQSSRSTTWYQQHDYDAFKKDCQKTAEIAQDLQCLRKLPYARMYISRRGIEHYVDEERLALRRERRLAAWEIVLDEQMDQNKSGDYQPQHIAKAYQEVSVRCQIEAHEKALQYLQESEVERLRDHVNNATQISARC